MKKYIAVILLAFLAIASTTAQGCDMYIDKSVLTEKYKTAIKFQEAEIERLLSEVKQTRLVSGNHPDTYVIVFFKEVRHVVSGDWKKIFLLKNYIMHYDILMIQNQRELIRKKQKCFKGK